MNGFYVISLNGEWTIKRMPRQDSLLTENGIVAPAEKNQTERKQIKIKGAVPGIVHHELIKHGIVDDPYYRMNELNQQWVGNSDWSYSRTFQLTSAEIAKQNIILNCEGLDTFATVYVNDRKVGVANNMYIRKRLNIKNAVKKGVNRIRIDFKSAGQMALRLAKDFLKKPGPRQGDWKWMGATGRGMIRKVPSHFGWDWGVCLPSCGIYRDICIECFDGARVLYLNNEQTHSVKGVVVKLKAIVESHRHLDSSVTFSLGNRNVTKRVELTPGENHIECDINIRNPKLWWPNGYGNQYLHTAKVVVECAKETHDLEHRIGLRDLKLVTSADPDGKGTSFCFEVNGIPIFAKGSNWIPSDIFDSRLSDEQIKWELDSAALASNNMIRVWGGGLYERDFFYERCDELGLLVWQDFMFACHLYPAHDEFLEHVSKEVMHQVRRLAHHPSIALWCGNNENEMALTWEQHKSNPVLSDAEYDRLYIQTIMVVANREDPTRRYWGSSPSNGVQLYGLYNDQTQGDMHYWDRNAPCQEYLKIRPRFVSEFGFQSFPSPETMATVTAEDDRNVFSPVFEHHQRLRNGNLIILTHIARQFKAPTGYENTLYLSQILQALSIKTACEHWRRCKPYTMGTLIWQLNDIWPVASWASLEYDGRWKMMHYAQRKFFAPLLLSAFERDGELNIWLTSDMNCPLKGELKLSLSDLDGNNIWRRSKTVRLERLGNKNVYRASIVSLVKREIMTKSVLRMEFQHEGGVVRNGHVFTLYKALELREPKLDCKVYRANGRIYMHLSADTFVPYVWIRHGNIHGTWSDNGMHLYPGETATLEFSPRYEATLEEMKKSIVIHDLYSSTKNG